MKPHRAKARSAKRPGLKERIEAFRAKLYRDGPAHWYEVQPVIEAEEDGAYLPMLHFLGRDGREHIYGCPLQGPAQKNVVASYMRLHAQSVDAIAVAMLTECWSAIDDGTQIEVRNRTDRQEGFLITIETVFSCYSMMWHIKRPDGQPAELVERQNITDAESRFFGAIDKLH